MPAVSAIVHGDAPSSKSIQLYFNTSTGQAGLALKSGTNAPDENIFFATGEDDYKGYILNPSQMAAAKFQGVNVAVAATTPNAHPITVNQISLVSPVYQKLTTTTLANNKLAMSSKDDNAWVYYLSGTSKYEVSLKEYNMDNGNIQTILEHQDVTLNSSLGAWYDTLKKNRFIVYQEVNHGNLKEYNITERQPHNIHTGDAMPLTPIGVTFHIGKVYVYYVDRSNDLQRVIKNRDDWGSPEPVEGTPPRVAPDSQVAVITSDNMNHIFYVSTEEFFKNPTTPKFTHFRDPI